MNNDRDGYLYWIWITTIKGIRKNIIKKLLNYFKTPENIWEQNLEELKFRFKLSDKEISIFEKSKDLTLIEKWIKKLEQKNISYYPINHPNYPDILKNIPNPPLGIYVKGNTIPFKKRYLGIVGTRNCSEYGRRVASKLSKELSSKGIGIISGLAKGIDTVAHKSTLEVDGFTIAVLANGVDICYPKCNMELMKKIEEKGTIISEFPPGTRPIPGFFPLRNRIISGLSQGVIVIEAGEKSGALITADLALEQGKEVFAVPGNIFNKSSIGTNKLIQQGAKLVMNIDDILSEIMDNFYINQYNKELQYKEKIINRLAKEENMVYDCISFEPSHIDILSSKTQYPMNKLQSILTLLELKGLIKQLPGKRFIRS
ncbi:DNA-processing protein DprA [Defluviitalea phaphyphila]|uniref:DNA-processing protein DprA n=1 Tax=Defluviitalea phaphyphila TaxID=1473580 RepID=UPI000730220D|nr:DNA-processing protein DprA [Defluviitalea phaphyphila]